MTTYYKAVRTDGLDFHSQTIDYGKAAKSRSKKITHPDPRAGSGHASRYFSVATVATDCTGFEWPARLFEVEPIGDVWTPHPANMPNKRAAAELRILRELPAWQLFGPEGEHIVAIIEKRDALTQSQRDALYAEYANTPDFWDTAYAVARDGRADRAGLRAAQGALRRQLRDWGDDDAACGAALAVLIRPHIGRGPDKFTKREYDTLSRPWRKVIGPIHPADKAVR